MKHLICTLICLWGALNCFPQTTGSTIDEPIQEFVDSALTRNLKNLHAEWGIAVVMEVETGKVLAQSAFERNDSLTFNINEKLLSTPIEQGSLFIPVSMLIALDDGVVSSQDMINTGNGVYSISGVQVRDHNYVKGGHGTINTSQVISVSSNVGIAKIIMKGYDKNPIQFYDKIKELGWDSLPANNPYGTMVQIREGYLTNRKSLPSASFGYNIALSPIGILTFYNAVANGGRMVMPQMEYKSTAVLKQSIASIESINALKTMLEGVIQSGTGKPIYSDTVSIAGKTGTAMIWREYNNQPILVSSCAYFPADKPRYSCIVAIFNPKEGSPSGGVMAGTIVKAIAENICLKK